MFSYSHFYFYFYCYCYWLFSCVCLAKKMEHMKCYVPQRALEPCTERFPSSLSANTGCFRHQMNWGAAPSPRTEQWIVQSLSSEIQKYKYGAKNGHHTFPVYFWTRDFYQIVLQWSTFIALSELSSPTHCCTFLYVDDKAVYRWKIQIK